MALSSEDFYNLLSSLLPGDLIIISFPPQYPDNKAIFLLIEQKNSNFFSLSKSLPAYRGIFQKICGGNLTGQLIDTHIHFRNGAVYEIIRANRNKHDIQCPNHL